MPHEAVRQKLIEELRTLSGRQDVIEAHLRNADRSVPDDWSDRATFTENDEVLEALDDHGRARLAALRGALIRIEEGVFGSCVSCGEDIDPRRLAAMPEAEQCVACAAESERAEANP